MCVGLSACLCCEVGANLSYGANTSTTWILNVANSISPVTTSLFLGYPTGNFHLWPGLPIGVTYNSTSGMIHGSVRSLSNITNHTVGILNAAGWVFTTVYITNQGNVSSDYQLVVLWLCDVTPTLVDASCVSYLFCLLAVRFSFVSELILGFEETHD